MVSRRATLRYALGAASRLHRGARAVTAATVAVSFACCAPLMITSAVREESLRALALAPDLTVRRARAGFARALSPSDARTLAGMPGALRVTPRVWGYVPMPGAGTLITVVGRSGDAPLDGLLLGRAPDPRERGWAAVGADLGRTLALQPGDGITVGGTHLRVRALFDPRVALRTADAVLCAPEDARAALGLDPGDSTDIAIDCLNPAAMPALREEVYRRLPDAVVTVRDDARRAIALSWGRRGGVTLLALLPALLALSVLAASRGPLGSAAAMREAATLRALGWSSAEVTRALTLAGALPAALASLLGTALGYLYTFPLGAPLLRDLLLGPSAELPFGQLSPSPQLADLFSLLALVLAPQLVTTSFAAWRAAVTDPWELLRR